MRPRTFRAGLFHRFRLDPEAGTIRHNREIGGLRGCRAEIASTGFLLTRRSHLSVTGPGFGWSVPIDSVTMARARRFAAAVNAAALAAEAEQGERLAR